MGALHIHLAFKFQLSYLLFELMYRLLDKYIACAKQPNWTSVYEFGEMIYSCTSKPRSVSISEPLHHPYRLHQ